MCHARLPHGAVEGEPLLLAVSFACFLFAPRTRYLMVAKTIRSFGSELGWRQRLCLLSRKAGGGMPPFQLDGLRALLVAGEFASVAWFYYKNVFWLTSHLTLVTMAFNLLFIATLGVWVHARRADPGYVQFMCSQ